MPIRFILSLCFDLLCVLAMAQSRAKTILLVDSASGQPLPYVSVLPAGSRGFLGDGQVHSPDLSFACDSSFDGRGFAVAIDLRREVPPGTEVVWIRKLSIPLRKDRADDRRVHLMTILVTDTPDGYSNTVLNREEIFIDQYSRFERNGTVTLDISAQRIFVEPMIIYIQLHFLRESPPRNYTSPQIYISGKPVDNFFSLQRHLPTKAGRIEAWSVFSRDAMVPYERFEQGTQSVWNLPIGVEVGQYKVRKQ